MTTDHAIETTSGVEPEVEIEYEGSETWRGVGKDEDGMPVRLEVEVPDDNVDELLSSVRVIEDSREEVEDGEPFEVVKAKYNSWDEMEAVAALKSGEGVWRDVDCLPEGTQVRFADVRKFNKLRGSLERRFRAKNPKYRKEDKNGSLKAIPDETAVDLFIAAAFNTAITGWRGPGFISNGRPVEFNLQNFQRAMRDFDELGVELGNKLGDINPSALEAVRKNS